jgi:hypothetical protein
MRTMADHDLAALKKVIRDMNTVKPIYQPVISWDFANYPAPTPTMAQRCY